MFVATSHADDAGITNHTILGERRLGDPFEGAARHGAEGHTYEFRIDLAATAPDQAFDVTTEIGLTVVVLDRDEDGSFSFLTWGMFVHDSAYGLGDLHLDGVSDFPSGEPSRANSSGNPGPPPDRVRSF